MKIPFPRNLQPKPYTTIQDFQEIAIVLYSPNLNPNLLSEKILKQKEIIPKTWKLVTKSAKIEDNLVQLPFKNGFQIILQPPQIIFISKITNRKSPIQSVILKYIQSFPEIIYQKLEINLSRLISLPGPQNSAKKFITENVLIPTGWENFHDLKPSTKIQFIYKINQIPLMLSINDVTINQPKLPPKSGLLFKANFTPFVFEPPQFILHKNLENLINNHENYLELFNKIVEDIFLNSSHKKS
jgi:hypothetical protein